MQLVTFFSYHSILDRVVWNHSSACLKRFRASLSSFERLLSASVCRCHVASVLRVETQHETKFISFRLFLPRFHFMFFFPVPLSKVRIPKLN